MKTWNDCVSFHGHECGGLTIGYKASLFAIELLKLDFSADEQVVCIAENDACGLDAIQVMLGCSVGKGNLLFHMIAWARAICCFICGANLPTLFTTARRANLSVLC